MLKAMNSLPSRVLAGVSGGADSVALLRLLVLDRETTGRQITAVHVNHGLRGSASDGDQAFVEELCGMWQVPLLTYRASPPDKAAQEWARDARYGFFAEAARTTGCRDLVLAHHRDDQAQTLLEHLLRGSGLTGLCGMLPVTQRNGLILHRPLLPFSRQELRGFLKEQGLSWRQDSSNQDPRYLRNALRLDILPRLNALIPGADQRLASAAAILQAEEQHLRTEAEAALKQASPQSSLLSLSGLQEMDMCIRRRVLREWWLRYGCQGTGALTSRQTESLCALPQSQVGSIANLPGRYRAFRGYRFLHLLPPTALASCTEVLPAVSGAALLGITLQLLPSQHGFGDGILTQELPAILLQGCVIRTRRPGDIISPFGSGKTQSLQDYLVNRRVDAPFRDRIPLLAKGNEVLMVCGVGTGGLPRIDPNDKALVRLCWTGDIPWRPEQV